jgi:hypothetical protein
MAVSAESMRFTELENVFIATTQGRAESLTFTAKSTKGRQPWVRSWFRNS